MNTQPDNTNDTAEWWLDPTITPHLEPNCFICGRSWQTDRQNDTSHDICWNEDTTGEPK